MTVSTLGIFQSLFTVLRIDSGAEGKSVNKYLHSLRSHSGVDLYFLKEVHASEVVSDVCPKMIPSQSSVETSGRGEWSSIEVRTLIGLERIHP